MAVTAGVFDESVAGQVIIRALSRGRLAHALLLQAADIETLEAFARHTAARILKLEASWADSTKGYADYFTLRPSGKSRQIKIGGGAEGVKENTMRHFTRVLAQSPLSGERKVGVVFEADRLNPSSANAFLKTLEEPPADTTILVLTTRPYSLLPTIRSRCLHFRIPSASIAVDDPELAAWFAEYREWLRGLTGATDAKKTSSSRQVMTVHALIARFSKWVEGAASQAFAQLKTDGALEYLDSEETEALKTTTSVGVRNRFFAALETETCAAAREIENSSAAAIESVAALERAANLLRVNLNENAALELFLLSALRAWSRKD